MVGCRGVDADVLAPKQAGKAGPVEGSTHSKRRTQLTNKTRLLQLLPGHFFLFCLRPKEGLEKCFSRLLFNVIEFYRFDLFSRELDNKCPSASQKI